MRRELEEVRERMVMGEGLMQELADLALSAPPSLRAELERIASLGHQCVTRNRAALTELLDTVVPLRAA